MSERLSPQQRLRQRIQQEKKAWPQYVPFLDFWERILLIQESFFSEIQPDEFGIRIDPPLLALKGQEGSPLLSFQEIPVDNIQLKALFQTLLNEVRTVNKKFLLETPKIEQWINDQGDLFYKWIRLLFEDNGQLLVQKAGEHGLDPELMLFLYLNSWKPFLKAQA